MATPLKILKPNEVDQDYLCDPTGHYRLAIADLIDKLSDAQKDRAWRWAQTALGGYRPLPQARKFHRSRKRFRHCLGGNRSSKSQSLAVETMWRAMGMHPFRQLPAKPTVGWYATTTFEKVSDTLWEKLNPSKGGLLLGIETIGYRWEVIWRSKQHEIPSKILIHLPQNGGTSEIIMKAYEQGRESFQAAALDYAHFDEQYSQTIFIETTSRIGAGKAMEFADAFTPLIPDQWLEERTYTNIPETDDVFHFFLDDNRDDWGGFIESSLIAATIENWPIEVRETRRYGRWGAYVGAIFQSFSREIHVVSEERERELFWRGDRITAEIQPYGVLDWGGSNPFGFIWAARIPWLDNEWYVFDELYWEYQVRGGRLLKDLANDILSRTRDVWKTNLFRVWADHDPTNVAEMRNHGLSTQPANKVGAADEISRAGIEEIQKILMPRPHMASAYWPMGRPRLHIAARCKELIREMPLYRWPEGTDAKDPRNVPVKKDDHLVDCLRYLVHTDRQSDGKPSQRIEANTKRRF